MNKPFSSDMFSGSVVLFAILILDGPFLHMALNGYRGAWYPLIMIAAGFGIIGVIGLFGWFATKGFYESIRIVEKRLITAGHEQHWAWGMVVGIATIIATVIFGVLVIASLIQVSAPVWQIGLAFIVVELGACLGLALLLLHNQMAEVSGERVFFF